MLLVAKCFVSRKHKPLKPLKIVTVFIKNIPCNVTEAHHERTNYETAHVFCKHAIYLQIIISVHSLAFSFQLSKQKL